MTGRPPSANPAPNVASAEHRLIARIFAPLALDPNAFNLTDDTAIVQVPGGLELVATTDTLVAGVHFFAHDRAFDIARKALRVNLSDLAAKGADPYRYLLNIALPASVNSSWLKRFAGSLRKEQDLFKCSLIGGDTVKTPGPLTVSISAFGLVPAGMMVKRSGAKVGDVIYLTGTIGDAALGLAVLQGDRAVISALSKAGRSWVRRRYRTPEPRVGLAGVLRKYATAAMDVSDGLAGDLDALCRTSGTTARIRVDDLPIAAAVKSAVKSNPSLLSRLLGGGDDYEILTTISPKDAAGFEKAIAQSGIAVTQIGHVLPGTKRPVFQRADGTELALEKRSFSHR